MEETMNLAKNSTAETMVLFGKLFPPQNRTENIYNLLRIVQPYLIFAAVLIAAVMKFLGEKFTESFLVALAWFNAALPPKTVSEKLNQLHLAAENSGAAGLAWIDKLFPSQTRTENIYALLHIAQLHLISAMKFLGEKLGEAFRALENFGGEALACFDTAFPPESRAERIQHWIHVARPYLAAVAALLVAVVLIRCILHVGVGILGMVVRGLIHCIIRVGVGLGKVMSALIGCIIPVGVGLGKMMRALIHDIVHGILVYTPFLLAILRHFF